MLTCLALGKVLVGHFPGDVAGVAPLEKSPDSSGGGVAHGHCVIVLGSTREEVGVP